MAGATTLGSETDTINRNAPRVAGKVIEAALKLRHQLTDHMNLQSEAHHLSGTESANPLMEVSDDPLQARLKERQCQKSERMRVAPTHRQS